MANFFPILVVASMGLFMLILAPIAIEDAIRHRQSRE